MRVSGDRATFSREAARRVAAFFAAYPALTERAQALIVAAPAGDIVPWE